MKSILMAHFFILFVVISSKLIKADIIYHVKDGSINLKPADCMVNHMTKLGNVISHDKAPEIMRNFMMKLKRLHDRSHGKHGK